MKKLTLFLAGAILVAAASLYILSITNTQSAQSSEKITASLSVDFHGNAPAINKTVQIEKGKTAFDLLKMNAEVEYKTYPGMGVFITKINNVSLSNEWYWIIFANENAINVAADKYVLKENDFIKYVYMSSNESKNYF